MVVDWPLQRLRFELYLEHIVKHGPISRIPRSILLCLAIYSFLSGLLTLITILVVLWTMVTDLKTVDPQNKYKPWHRAKPPNLDKCGLISGALFFASGRLMISLLLLIAVKISKLAMYVLSLSKESKIYIYMKDKVAASTRFTNKLILNIMGIHVIHYDFNNGNPEPIDKFEIRSIIKNSETIVMNHISIWEAVICESMNLKIHHPHLMMKVLGTSERSRINQHISSKPIVIFPEGVPSSGHTLLPFSHSIFVRHAGAKIQPAVLVYETAYAETHQWDYYSGVIALIISAADIRRKYVKIYWLNNITTHIDSDNRTNEFVHSAMSAALRIVNTQYFTSEDCCKDDREGARRLVRNCLWNKYFKRSGNKPLNSPEGTPLLNTETEDYMTFHDSSSNSR